MSTVLLVSNGDFNVTNCLNISVIQFVYICLKSLIFEE